MSTSDKVIITRTLEKARIDFEAWSEETVNKYPITKQHIGTQVRYAKDPKSKNYTLLEIKEVGDEFFPEGGYILEEKYSDFKLNVFLDEVIPYEKKKKVQTANSQLARKKRTPKTTKKAKTAKKRGGKKP